MNPETADVGKFSSFFFVYKRRMLNETRKGKKAIMAGKLLTMELCFRKVTVAD